VRAGQPFATKPSVVPDKQACRAPKLLAVDQDESCKQLATRGTLGAALMPLDESHREHSSRVAACVQGHGGCAGVAASVILRLKAGDLQVVGCRMLMQCLRAESDSAAMACISFSIMKRSWFYHGSATNGLVHWTCAGHYIRTPFCFRAIGLRR
jgi:hypothetical protein